MASVLAAAPPGSTAAPAKMDPRLAAEILAWSHSDMTANQWGLTAIRAPLAWQTSTGAGVTVAVIDTGLDMTHPDVAGQTVSPGYVWQLGTENGKVVGHLRPATAGGGLVPQIDTVGHGTHVAGVVAGNANGEGITGVAPNARLLPINLASALDESTTLSQFAKAFTAAMDTAVRDGARVINVSLGGAELELPWQAMPRSEDERRTLAASRRICAAIDRARAAGVVTVVSSGNSAEEGNPRSVPGLCPAAVEVGAVGPSLERGYFSTYNGRVDLTAPGVGVLSSTPARPATPSAPSMHGYEWQDGTSFASPHVSGVAALLFSGHPQWNADQVIEALFTSVTDRGIAGRDPEFGRGVLDAAAAVDPVANPAGTVTSVDAFIPRLRLAANDRGEFAFSFNPPSVHLFSGFTVTVVNRNTGTTRSYQLPGDAVSTPAIPPSSWVRLGATTTDGQAFDAGWLPTPPVAPRGKFQAPLVSAPRWVRQRHSLWIRWANGKYVDAADITVVVACPVVRDAFSAPLENCSRLKTFDNPRYRTHALVFVPPYVRGYDLRVWVMQSANLTGIPLFDAVLAGVKGTAKVKGQQRIFAHAPTPIRPGLISLTIGVNPSFAAKTPIGTKVMVRYRTARGRYLGGGHAFIAGGYEDSLYSFNRSATVTTQLKTRRALPGSTRVQIIVDSRHATSRTVRLADIPPGD
ncbi:MAG: S8 family serine peptidase [Actinobacteria bacterium]|nr:S8 family serine peptidase [Actinomycetota bacterium]MCB8997715.1 S8 family serine peptidase [Actinomycetota bacterium]